MYLSKLFNFIMLFSRILQFLFFTLNYNLVHDDKSFYLFYLRGIIEEVQSREQNVKLLFNDNYYAVIGKNDGDESGRKNYL